MPEKSEQLEIGSTHKGKRVEIYMEVDDKGKTRREIIPFVVGVLAPLAGDRERPDGLKTRVVHSIDRENFDEVMEKIGPELIVSVESTIPGDPKVKDPDKKRKMGAKLSFKRMEDFEPENVARQISDLEVLLDERKRLQALLLRLQANDRLKDKIEAALDDPTQREAMLAELGI